MSIQDELQAAAEEYARRLEKQREEDRLAALTLEAQHHANGALFAAAIEAAFTNSQSDTDTTQEIQ